jgi:hypothetical protein
MATAQTATDDTRTCYACGFKTTEPLKRCPSCGSVRFRTVRAVRRIGWVLVVLGGALVAFMGYLSLAVAHIIYRTEAGRTGGTTFTGDAEDAALIYGVFGFVAAIGAGALFGGAWQIRHGRPNRVVMAVAFVLMVLILFFGRAFRAFERFGG